MKIIPGVNCADEQCLENRFAVLRTLFKETEFHKNPLVHLDISDGVFTPMHTIEDFRTVFRLRDRLLPEVRIRVHCMVQDPVRRAKEWLTEGADGVFIHFDIPEREKIATLVQEYGDKIGIVVTTETKLEDVIPFAREISAKNVLVLAVRPGFSAQRFDEKALEIMGALRNELRNVTIGADGGMNPETVAKVQRAGVEYAVSSSFLFNHDDPARAFRELEKATL